MKTILIAHNFSEISFAAMSYNLAHHLADLGNNVIFISHNPYLVEEKIVATQRGKLTVTSWSSNKRPTSLKDCIWYSKIYFKHQPQIIIGHFVGSNISIMLSKFFSFGKVKTYEYYHTLSKQLLTDIEVISFKQKLMFFRKFLFYKFCCDTIICPSLLAKDDFEQFYKNKNATVVLNPMVDRFKSTTIRTTTTNSILINYLGRLDPSKGIIPMLQAFNLYKTKFQNTRIILTVAGSGSLESEIKELEKENLSMRYIGSLNYDAIDEYLKNGDFTIIPSVIDNLPTVGLESLMNETPLLISNQTGLTNYLVDGNECFKFDPKIEDMVLLFKKVEDSFVDITTMRNAARATFLKHFGMNNYCTVISKLIS